ncbi:hypothetical protein GCM10018781_38430 [Kitasatospora indigofera]|uniref:Uncharacterized protein n=1 Tax=Kitasatospora indigofera TaxID=67307 RepID=A0A919KV40_9ACTN|nr:hypothetical protein [Kitasatospora indigofera]GHH73617.1 hypothetical protein GCM10018781_38430 [Kitasatospora indigofera]
MLEAALAALAAAGGTAVVQAAGTDAWNGFRTRVARLIGRGDGQREHAELERLDRTADVLEAVGPGEAEQVRIRQEASWQTRFEALLESLTDVEREQVAAELRILLHEEDPRPQPGSGGMSGNTFHGPTAVQFGDGNRQDNRFGSGA